MTPLVALITAGLPEEVWQLRRADGSPYLTRRVLWGANALETHDADAPSSAFVHMIHAADGDRHMHNHPWVWAASLVLTGGYTEVRRARHDNVANAAYAIGRTYKCAHREGDLTMWRPDDYHSIVSVEPGTVTLFLCGREAHDWGFLVDGAHVPHKAYFEHPDAQRMTHARVA